MTNASGEDALDGMKIDEKGDEVEAMPGSPTSRPAVPSLEAVS